MGRREERRNRKKNSMNETVKIIIQNTHTLAGNMFHFIISFYPMK